MAVNKVYSVVCQSQKRLFSCRCHIIDDSELTSILKLCYLSSPSVVHFTLILSGLSQLKCHLKSLAPVKISTPSL